MNAELKSANEARLSRKRPRLIDFPDTQLPFGSFSGETIYRNRLHRNEALQDGHVSLSNLVLPGCTSALCTTFVGPDTLWLERVFDSVDNLLVVRHDDRQQGRVIGDADLSPIPTSNEKRQGWFWIAAKPHTGGLLHAKLVLFRCKEGLRVAVVGSNLTQGQWEGDRDTLWVQDFGATPHPYDFKQFGCRLRSFLNDLVQCHDFDHQLLAQSMIKAMFDKIEFATASVRLVVSFPRPSSSDADWGGWRQLANAVDQLLREIDNGSDHGSDEGFEENSKKEGPTAVHAMAGSFGDLQPDFVLQMHQAFHGKNENIPKDTEWDAVEGMRCLWPSRDTASSMNPDALVHNMRGMTIEHWNTIPQKARERIFFDALPNPKETQLEFHPISHAKVIYAGGRGIIYVGSHNFSKAAWGLRDAMPKNVEIGVVLGSESCSTRQQWRERLPYFLPADSDLSPPNYIPASAHAGIREAYERGRVDEARKMLRDHLNSNDGSNIALSEVIDLCDSD